MPLRHNIPVVVYGGGVAVLTQTPRYNQVLVRGPKTANMLSMEGRPSWARQRL